MISEFCPICGDIMVIVPMSIQGTVYDFWVCPAGDWEAPAGAEAEHALAEQEDSV